MRPDTLAEVAVPGATTAVTDGVVWIVKEVAVPPVLGSLQCTVADVTPGVAVTPVGVAGSVYTVTENGPTVAAGVMPFAALTE